MIWQSHETIAPGVAVGAFALPDQLLAGFGTARPRAAGDAQLEAIRGKASQKAVVRDGVVWVAADPDKPVVGDYQISFSEVPLQTVSVVGRQDGSRLGVYRTEAGQSVELVAAGETAADSMFNPGQDEDRLWIWALRAVGTLMMIAGFALCLGPFKIATEIVPQLAHVIHGGPSFIGLLGAAVLIPLVVAVAWVSHRPLVALVALVVGAALTAGAVYFVRQRRTRQALARD
jgi:hypothetical protein